VKKCCFCSEELPDTTAVCPWCGRRQQQQQKSPVEPRESPIKIEYDFSGGAPIKIEYDFSGRREELKRFLADIPWEMEMVHVILSEEELVEWDARDERVRETSRHSQRELDRREAEARRHLVALVESEDGTILSICKSDKAGTWQFVDLEDSSEKRLLSA